MSSTSGAELGRTETRFHISKPSAISVTIERPGNPTKFVAAVLMDLSHGGVRLAVEESVPKDENVRLTIDVQDIHVQIHADAKVCWTSPGPKSGWLLGCSLGEQIASEAIDRLAAGSLVERRRDDRQSIGFSAQAKSELAFEFSPVQIINYSAGGFRALATNAISRPGDRLMIRVVDADTGESHLIRGKVAWENSLGEGQSIGCTFLTRDDYFRMQRLVNPDSRNHWLQSIQRYRPTRWGMIAASVTLLLTLQIVFISRNRPDLVRRFDEQVMQRVETWFHQVRD